MLLISLSNRSHATYTNLLCLAQVPTRLSAVFTMVSSNFSWCPHIVITLLLILDGYNGFGCTNPNY